MGFLDFFKRKKKSSLTAEESQLMDKMADLLYGGMDNMRKQIGEVSALLGNRYKPGEVANALTYLTSGLMRRDDKSIGAMVDEGQMRRPNNPFNRADAIVIYKYVLRQSYKKQFPGMPDEMLDVALQGVMGDNPDGATTDVIPGAYGEYGFDATNPIPTRGIPSNEVYLSRLFLLSGEPIRWERVGSFGAPNIKNPIDGYSIMDKNGTELCVIYISPYQNIISKKAPKGFYLK